MPADHSFLGDTCKQWEECVAPVKEMGKRLVTYRIGIVLSTKGGALAEFMKPLRFGIAPILGNGRQIISWIHIDDLCRLFLYAIEQEKLNGVFNAVAPNPVSNKLLTTTLAGIQKGKAYIPAYVPSFVLKLMMGEMSIEVLKSSTVSAEKIRKTGFQFLYPTIAPALQDLVRTTDSDLSE
jgi:uncharacterized protein (TIGR01777 family)